MHASQRAWRLGIAVMLWTGCAPALTSPGPGEPLNAKGQIRAAILDRPPVPDLEDMLPNMELVTYPEVRGRVSVRDTIRSSYDAVRWLEHLRAQTEADASPFSLVPREILICEGAVVEAGRYTLRGLTNQVYIALWRPSETEWKIERLWLQPPYSVRPGRLAPGCSRNGTETPVRFGVAVGEAEAVGLHEVADSLAGLPDQLRPGNIQPALHLWIGFKMSSRVKVNLGVTVRPSARIEARDTGTVAQVVFAEDFKLHMASLTGEVRFGHLTVEAGPALALLHTRSVLTNNGARDPVVDNESESLARLGLMARLSTRFPVSSKLNALGSVGYSLFPGIRLPYTVPGASVILPGPAVLVGLEWQP